MEHQWDEVSKYLSQIDIILQLISIDAWEPGYNTTYLTAGCCLGLISDSFLAKMTPSSAVSVSSVSCTAADCWRWPPDSEDTAAAVGDVRESASVCVSAEDGADRAERIRGILSEIEIMMIYMTISVDCFYTRSHFFAIFSSKFILYKFFSHFRWFFLIYGGLGF